MGIGIGIGIGVGQARKGGGAAPLPGFDSTTYADYPTGLAATTDGKYFSVNLSDGLARYVWQRVSGAGELAAIYPVNYAAASAAQKAAGNTGAGGEQLPTSPWLDAVAVDGLWYDGPLPNRAGAKSDFNLFGASRTCDVPWFGQNSTIGAGLGYTLANGTWVLTPFTAGPDGLLKALRIAQSATTGSVPLFYFPILIPPGRWTLAFDIVSNAGNQTLQYCDNLVTGMSNMALTGAWQTFSKTFTLTAPTTRNIVFVGANPTAVAFDVTLDNIRLIPGSAAGSATPSASNLYRRGATKRTGYFPDNTSGTPAVRFFGINRGDTVGHPAISICAAVRHTGSFVASDQIFTQVEETGFQLPSGAFVFGHGPNAQPVGTPGGPGFTAANLNSALTNMAGMSNGSWSIIVSSSGSSGSKLWIDGMLVASSITAYSGFTARVFEVLSARNGVGYFPGQVASLTSWDRQISDTEALNASAVARARLIGMGESYAEPLSSYIAVGDSITVGQGATNNIYGYSQRVGAYFSPYLQGSNFGISGAGVSVISLTANINLVLAQVATVLAHNRRPIVSVFIGNADMPQTTAAADALVAGLVSYYGQIKAAGAKVVASTLIAMNAALGGNEAVYETTIRQYFCTQIRNASASYDALCDFAANANMNTWSSTYFADDRHPNDLGHATMAPIMAAAVNSVWI